MAALAKSAVLVLVRADEAPTPSSREAAIAKSSRSRTRRNRPLRLRYSCSLCSRVDVSVDVPHELPISAWRLPRATLNTPRSHTQICCAKKVGLTADLQELPRMIHHCYLLAGTFPECRLRSDVAIAKIATPHCRFSRKPHRVPTCEHGHSGATPNRNAESPSPCPYMHSTNPITLCSPSITPPQFPDKRIQHHRTPVSIVTSTDTQFPVQCAHPLRRQVKPAWRKG